MHPFGRLLPAKIKYVELGTDTFDLCRFRAPSFWYNTLMNNCLFCTIANGDPAKLIWQNEIAVSFHDIHPKAPVHVLVVLKQHVANLDELDDETLAGQLMLAGRDVARQLGINHAYRFHINNGRAAGQEIDHLHIHLLGNLSPAVIDELRNDGL